MKAFTIAVTAGDVAQSYFSDRSSVGLATICPSPQSGCAWRSAVVFQHGLKTPKATGHPPLSSDQNRQLEAGRTIKFSRPWAMRFRAPIDHFDMEIGQRSDKIGLFYKRQKIVLLLFCNSKDKNPLDMENMSNSSFDTRGCRGQVRQHSLRLQG